MTKQTTNEEKKYWSKVREFNLSRTLIWILFAWQLVETFIPFLTIWLLLSPDFKNSSFNFYNQLGTSAIGLFVSMSLTIIIWALAINFLTFFLRWQKADSFTFTIAFLAVFLMILLNSLWQHEWMTRTDLKIFIRFIIALLMLVPAMFLGLITTSLFRNWQYRVEEDNEAMILAYQNQEFVPSKQKLKLERALKYKAKREAEAIELAKFKEELDLKLITAYNENQARDLAREKKLDEKEDRKRAKAQAKAKKKK